MEDITVGMRVQGDAKGTVIAVFDITRGGKTTRVANVRNGDYLAVNVPVHALYPASAAPKVRHPNPAADMMTQLLASIGAV